MSIIKENPNVEYIHISKVKLEGIHKRYNLEIDFNDGLNILYGQNGTGKSTLIHIIANVANCDFLRFAFIDFKRISVTYSNKKTIQIIQKADAGDKKITIKSPAGKVFSFSQRDAIETIRESEDERFNWTPQLTYKINEFIKKNGLTIIETSYFPAFRTMLEAWSSQRDLNTSHPVSSRVNRARSNEETIRQATMFSRNLFGLFLPTINYPSPLEIEQSLRDQIRDCQIRIARYESSIFSDSFVKVFSALLNGSSIDISTEGILEEISQLTTDSNTSKMGDFEENSKTYKELQQLVKNSSQNEELTISASGALAVYRDALKERRNFQQEAFSEVDNFFDVVNSFLDNKELSYALDTNRRVPKVGLKFPDDSWSSIKVMSSGERQLLTMLYSLNRMRKNAMVLIDEPEISLHIDWQEDLLERMLEQLGNRQIIVCTHSPAIAAGFEEYMKEVTPIFRDTSDDDSDLMCDEEERF
ncbi:AAA family ATPase [Aeromonas oralensis]|uniref:AAA family ATPase n=1 Tax=Aeromonas oralensis TaxID=3415010 RepID=UPI003F68D916